MPPKMLARSAALTIFLTLCPWAVQAAGPLPLAEGPRKIVPQASVMAAQAPDLSDCSALAGIYAAGGWPQVRDAQGLRVLDRMLRARFRARADGPTDAWSPQLARVLTGATVVGDCDDLATTAVALAVCAGVPPQDLGLLMTTDPSGGPDRHLVALYHAPDGKVWTFGNTLSRAAPLSRRTPAPIAWARADRVDLWWSLTDSRPPRGTAAIPSPAQD